METARPLRIRGNHQGTTRWEFEAIRPVTVRDHTIPSPTVSAAKTMIKRAHDDRFDLWPQRLIADTGYGSARDAGWSMSVGSSRTSRCSTSPSAPTAPSRARTSPTTTTATPTAAPPERSSEEKAGVRAWRWEPANLPQMRHSRARRSTAGSVESRPSQITVPPWHG